MQKRMGNDSGELVFSKSTAELTRLARENRRKATSAEQFLWSLVRRRQVHGVPFRRQHPLGRFIADFYCDAARLVVEIDGAYHQEPTQQERDAARETIIRANRLHVLRFTNAQVLDESERVISEIAEFIEAALSPPAPLSHAVGEGGEATERVPPAAALLHHASTPPSPTAWERGAGGERAPVGTHLLLDLYDIAPGRLTDAGLLAGALTGAARDAGMTPLSEPVLHRFPGGGLTGFLPLAESHIAFHSYPELGYLAADVFTCGPDPDAPDRAVAVLLAALKPGRPSVRRFDRGADVEVSR